MPELPEVETVRRMLETAVVGRTVRSAAISGAALRSRVPRELPRALPGRSVREVRRHGKYLLLDLDDGRTLISHLGMSGRWLFWTVPPRTRPAHVHLRIRFRDGAGLWYQDTRRFGLLRLAPTGALGHDPSLAALGPDPLGRPPSGASLRAAARGLRRSVKDFLLDQRRIAGLGNIYASEILHRAGLDPRRRAGAVSAEGWERVARETVAVLEEAIARMGTTFDTYRTPWGEPGGFGDRLRVYDRAGEPCRACGTPIRRIVQGQRSTFFCPACQPRSGLGPASAPAGGRSRRGRDRDGAHPRSRRRRRAKRPGRAARRTPAPV